MLAEVIGEKAMLEQLAEECSELTKASLKLARHLRGENKVHCSVEELYSNLTEEMVDVLICITEIMCNTGLVSDEKVNEQIFYKRERMKKRLEDYAKEMEDQDLEGK